VLEEQASVQLKTEDQLCLKDLRLTDPRDDMVRIKQTKGGLLDDAYRWILNNPDFRQWRDDEQQAAFSGSKATLERAKRCC
jgi:hypothetical protein